MAITKADAAAALREIALLLEYHEESTFKIRAFDNAARALLADARPMEELLKPGGLEGIKGIGKGTALVVRGMAASETGESDMLAELKVGAPLGFRDLMRVPKLGAKKVKALHTQLGVNTLEDLQAVCSDGRMAGCPGFSKKSSEVILATIEQMSRFSGMMLLNQAEALAEPVLEALRRCPDVVRVEVAGSLRRRKEVVGDLDFVASSDHPQAVMECFRTLPWVSEVIAAGDTKSSIVTAEGIQADLRVVPDSQFATALHHFTGSKEHNTELRSRALKQGFSISEYGLSRTEDPKGPRVEVGSEEELFKLLGLGPIAPELREGMGEIEAAAKKRLPKLITMEDYRGVLHCHTTWSDGRHSIREMALAAKKLGWEYFAVADHSQVAAYAGGVKVAEIADQHAEIDEVNAELAGPGFRILKSCECDILADGALDYPEEILAQMDIVVASIHSRHGQDARATTARLIRAIENPYAHIIGHISGRLLLNREPYDFDLDEVLAAAAATGTVIEINADPRRLDMDWRHVRRAKELGIRFSVNPDAHSVAALGNVRYGIDMARKAWLERGDVVNCLGVEELLEQVAGRRRQG